MIIIKATISGHEVNLGSVEDDFDIEEWIKAGEASLEILGVTNVHGIHHPEYPKFVIPGNHNNTLRDRIAKLFSSSD